VQRKLKKKQQDLLDCCVPLKRAKQDGVTMSELACLAVCNGVTCDTHRPPQELWCESDENVGDEFGERRAPLFERWVDELRSAVVLSCGSVNSHRLMASYDRSTLGQTGTGHFSPIAAYHRASDRVLIMDVARFKYPPHWVSLRLLARAMLSKDSATQRSRGFQLVSPDTRHSMPPAVRVMHWRDARLLLLESLRARVTSTSTKLDDAGVLQVLADVIVEALKLGKVTDITVEWSPLFTF
jgi:hypothetical protein